MELFGSVLWAVFVVAFTRRLTTDLTNTEGTKSVDLRTQGTAVVDIDRSSRLNKHVWFDESSGTRSSKRPMQSRPQSTAEQAAASYRGTWKIADGQEAIPKEVSMAIPYELLGGGVTGCTAQACARTYVAAVGVDFEQDVSIGTEENPETHASETCVKIGETPYFESWQQSKKSLGLTTVTVRLGMDLSSGETGQLIIQMQYKSNIITVTFNAISGSPDKLYVTVKREDKNKVLGRIVYERA